MKQKIWSVAVIALIRTGSKARAECDLSQLVGYKLIAEKTVDGYIQDGKRSDVLKGAILTAQLYSTTAPGFSA